MAIEKTARLGLTKWTDPDYGDPFHVDQFNEDADALEEAFTTLDGTIAPVVNVKAYGATGDGVTDDTPFVSVALADAQAAGASLYFPTGHYLVDPFVVNMSGVAIVGQNKASTILYCRGVAEHFIKFQKTGERFTPGGVHNIGLHANGNATYGVLVDTSRMFTATDVKGWDFPGHLFDLTSDQVATVFTEAFAIRDCDTQRNDLASVGGLARLRCGTGGRVADGVIQNCISLSLDGWGIELHGTHRVTVENYGAANNTSSFDGAVLLDNDPEYGISDNDITTGNVIRDIYAEDASAGGAAVCVKIAATATSTRFVTGNMVTGTETTPSTRKHLVLVNDAASNLNRANSFTDPRQPIVSDGQVDIGAGCILNHIDIPGHNGVALSSAVADAGLYNRLNRQRQAAYGPRTKPGTTQLDVGDVVRNTDDDSLWMVDRSGTLRQLAGPYISSVATNAVLSAGVTGDSVNRLDVRANGSLVWGPGNAALDTNLYRAGPNVLKTDDRFVSANSIGIGGSGAATTLGSVVRQIPVYDADGTTLLGRIPIYNSIT